MPPKPLWKPGEECYSILVLGEPASGKTGFVRRFVTNQFAEPANEKRDDSAVDMCFRHIEMPSVESLLPPSAVKLRVWDGRGEPRFHALMLNYLSNVSGVFVVFDASDPRSFDRVSDWIDSIEEHVAAAATTVTTTPTGSMVGRHAPTAIPELFLVGAKTDKLTPSQLAELQQKMTDTYQIPCFLVSAKSGSAVTEAFTKMTERIRLRTSRSRYGSITSAADSAGAAAAAADGVPAKSFADKFRAERRRLKQKFFQSTQSTKPEGGDVITVDSDYADRKQNYERFKESHTDFLNQIRTVSQAICDFANRGLHVGSFVDHSFRAAPSYVPPTAVSPTAVTPPSSAAVAAASGGGVLHAHRHRTESEDKKAGARPTSGGAGAGGGGAFSASSSLDPERALLELFVNTMRTAKQVSDNIAYQWRTKNVFSTDDPGVKLAEAVKKKMSQWEKARLDFDAYRRKVRELMSSNKAPDPETLKAKNWKLLRAQDNFSTVSDELSALLESIEIVRRRAVFGKFRVVLRTMIDFITPFAAQLPKWTSLAAECEVMDRKSEMHRQLTEQARLKAANSPAAAAGAVSPNASMGGGSMHAASMSNLFAGLANANGMSASFGGAVSGAANNALSPRLYGTLPRTFSPPPALALQPTVSPPPNAAGDAAATPRSSDSKSKPDPNPLSHSARQKLVSERMAASRTLPSSPRGLISSPLTPRTANAAAGAGLIGKPKMVSRCAISGCSNPRFVRGYCSFHSRPSKMSNTITAIPPFAVAPGTAFDEKAETASVRSASPPPPSAIGSAPSAFNFASASSEGISSSPPKRAATAYSSVPSSAFDNPEVSARMHKWEDTQRRAQQFSLRRSFVQFHELFRPTDEHSLPPSDRTANRLQQPAVVDPSNPATIPPPPPRRLMPAGGAAVTPMAAAGSAPRRAGGPHERRPSGSVAGMTKMRLYQAHTAFVGLLPNDLSLALHCTVLAHPQPGREWWKGYLNGAWGYFPARCVSRFTKQSSNKTMGQLSTAAQSTAAASHLDSKHSPAAESVEGSAASIVGSRSKRTSLSTAQMRQKRVAIPVSPPPPLAAAPPPAPAPVVEGVPPPPPATIPTPAPAAIKPPPLPTVDTPPLPNGAITVAADQPSLPPAPRLSAPSVVSPVSAVPRASITALPLPPPPLPPDPNKRASVVKTLPPPPPPVPASTASPAAMPAAAAAATAAGSASVRSSSVPAATAPRKALQPPPLPTAAVALLGTAPSTVIRAPLPGGVVDSGAPKRFPPPLPRTSVKGSSVSAAPDSKSKP